MLYCALAKLSANLFLHYVPYLGLTMNMEKGFCTFFQQQQHHYLRQQPNGKTSIQYQKHVLKIFLPVLK